MMPASVNARVTRATCSTVTPFFMSSSSRSDATSSPPLTATQPGLASSAQSSGVNVFSKRMLPHQVMLNRSSSRALRERAHAGRRRGLVDEVKAGLAGLRDQRANARHDDVGARPVVAADVVERHVAEAALLPVAAVRERDLVPAAVGPEPVHRVQHLEHGHVVGERQAVVGRRAGVALREVVLRRVGLEHDGVAPAHERAHERRAAAREPREQIQQRPLAVVERHVVEVVERRAARAARAARC